MEQAASAVRNLASNWNATDQKDEEIGERKVSHHHQDEVANGHRFSEEDVDEQATKDEGVEEDKEEEYRPVDYYRGLGGRGYHQRGNRYHNRGQYRNYREGTHEEEG